jgi:hypothetical protein
MRSMGDDGELDNSRLTSDHAFCNLIAKLCVRLFRHYVNVVRHEVSEEKANTAKSGICIDMP